MYSNCYSQFQLSKHTQSYVRRMNKHTRTLSHCIRVQTQPDIETPTPHIDTSTLTATKIHHWTPPKRNNACVYVCVCVSVRIETAVNVFADVCWIWNLELNEMRDRITVETENLPIETNPLFGIFLIALYNEQKESILTVAHKWFITI